MSTATLRFLSGTNGFMPEVTGEVVAYVRKEKEFPLNRYAQYVPVDEPVGLYHMLGRDEFVRIVSDEEHAWEDGDESPQGQYNQVPYIMQEFRCFRRAYPWRLGYMAIGNTKGWKPKAIHMDMAISKAM